MIVINTGFSANSCDIIWNVSSFCTIIDFFIGNQRTKEQLFIKGNYLRIKCEMENWMLEFQSHEETMKLIYMHTFTLI